jgi:hypothetical protein
MAVPYTFGSATASIPLSQLDSNFATTITLGNVAVQLGNTVTSLTGVTNVASATSLTLGSNGNTTAVTIDASQNVGVGVTPSAWNTFTSIIQIPGGSIAGADASQMGIWQNAYYNSGYKYKSTAAATFYQQSGASHIWYNAPSGTAGNAITFTQAMTLDSGGNFLLGTTSQIGTGKVNIIWNGTTANAIELQESSSASGAGFASFRNSGATQIGSITRNGTTNAVLFNTTSDQRLKSNITDSDVVLDKLLTVKVRQFDWTEGDLHQDYGFIAQELEPILSGIVTKGKTEKDVWQLDYSRLTPHLLKALQEQQALITSLTERITALEAK